MKIKLISVGTRMPAWVGAACAEYSSRLGREWGFSLEEVPLVKRSKTVSIDQCREREGEALLGRSSPADFRVALCVDGKLLDTQGLADCLEALRQDGRDLSLMVGGPDGLSPACQQQADARWSLGRLTLPHPLVRIVLLEQLYRASCILKGHPYHRE